MTSPEFKEEKERYRESQMFSEKVEKKILDKIRKQESYSDVVFCPNISCGVPVKIIDELDMIILKCSMCGFEKKIDKV